VFQSPEGCFGPAAMSSGEATAANAAVKPKPVQRYMRRGEGTQRRVFGPQLLKTKQQQQQDQQDQQNYPARSKGSRDAQALPSQPSQAGQASQPANNEWEELAELQAETTLVQLEEEALAKGRKAGSGRKGSLNLR